MLAPRRGGEVLDAWDFWQRGRLAGHRAEWIGVLQARSIAGGAIPADDYALLKAEILAGLVAAGRRGAARRRGARHPRRDERGRDRRHGGRPRRAVRAVVGPDCLSAAGWTCTATSRASSPRPSTCSPATAPPRTSTGGDQGARGPQPRRPAGAARGAGGRRRRGCRCRSCCPARRPPPGRSRRRASTRGCRRSRRATASSTPRSGSATRGRTSRATRAVVMVAGDDADAGAGRGERRWRASCGRAATSSRSSPRPGRSTSAGRGAGRHRHGPFFISDSGDNPTAGGAGDVTWTLAELLGQPALARVARARSTPRCPTRRARGGRARPASAAPYRHGRGAVDDRHAPPGARCAGTVVAVVPSDANLEVVSRRPAVDVILTRLRRPYHLETDFTRLGLDPRRADIVFVKIGYLEPELFDMAAGWRLALTPGGVDQDLVRLRHRRDPAADVPVGRRAGGRRWPEPCCSRRRDGPHCLLTAFLPLEEHPIDTPTAAPARICVVGSINADVRARCASFPRPGETVLARSTEWGPGRQGRQPGRRSGPAGCHRGDGRRGRIRRPGRPGRRCARRCPRRRLRCRTGPTVRPRWRWSWSMPPGRTRSSCATAPTTPWAELPDAVGDADAVVVQLEVPDAALSEAARLSYGSLRAQRGTRAGRAR